MKKNLLLRLAGRIDNYYFLVVLCMCLLAAKFLIEK
jgi:hypothetical protein